MQPIFLLYVTYIFKTTYTYVRIFNNRYYFISSGFISENDRFGHHRPGAATLPVPNAELGKGKQIIKRGMDDDKNFKKVSHACYILLRRFF